VEEAQMKLRMLFAVLVATQALAPHAIAAGKAAPKPQRLKPDCAFAAWYVKDAVAQIGTRPFLLDLEPFKPYPPSPGHERPREAELWSSQPASSLFRACPHLLTTLPANVRVATQDEKAISQMGVGAPRWVDVTAWSAPLAAPDGKTVIMETRTRCPGLCGSGQVAVYKRVGARWVIDHTLALWMS